MPQAKLVNAAAYRFVSFIPPQYSQIAKTARIQGTVDLELALDPATGRVLKATAVAGHAMLRVGATMAAQQWRFEPGSLAGDSLAGC